MSEHIIGIQQQIAWCIVEVVVGHVETLGQAFACHCQLVGIHLVEEVILSAEHHISYYRVLQINQRLIVNRRYDGRQVF